MNKKSALGSVEDLINDLNANIFNIYDAFSHFIKTNLIENRPRYNI